MPHHSTHPSSGETPVAQEQTWAACLLAWVAGFSDAIGFLLLQQLGASFMSGNSMATGAALGQMDGHSVLLYGIPILSFVLGIMLGWLVLTLVRHCGVCALPSLSSLVWKPSVCWCFSSWTAVPSSAG